MARLACRRSLSLIVVSLLCVSSIIFFRADVTQAIDAPEGNGTKQDTFSRNERTLRKVPWKNEVVQVTRMKTRKGLVEFDRKFSDDDDWLKGFTLTVKNISDKEIIFIDASVTLFNKGGPDETDMVPVKYPFSFGSEQEADATSASDSMLRPGDSVDITFSEKDYAGLQTLLIYNNYPLTFRKAEVAVETVLFADGLMWYKSFYFLRDPYNPNKWVRDKHFKKGGKYEHLKPPALDGENIQINPLTSTTRRRGGETSTAIGFGIVRR